MNYYELLGISNTATEEEIKQAYKKQMKKWHPDINKDEQAVSMSMKINEAKDILLNADKRAEYDLFLKEKEKGTYEKYSRNKAYERTTNTYEQHMVTKWEYLKEYLQSKDISLFKKVISTLFVCLESVLCFIIKWFIIGLAFICFSLGDIIFMAFYYIFPIIVILLAFLIYMWMTKGFSNLVSNHIVELRGFIIVVLTFISSFVFVFIGKKLISQKVFNFLYNKLDIYLFKKAVFYGKS